MPAGAMIEEAKEEAMKTILNFGQSAYGYLRGLGPYLLIELILPGGSLIALLLWLYNHRTART